jgi:hypothetical protein
MRCSSHLSWFDYLNGIWWGLTSHETHCTDQQQHANYVLFVYLCRHSRKPTTAYTTSRSGSLERGSTGGAGPGGAWGPAQPFVADPSMPPLPVPHTDTQLEEARRRLLEEDGRPKTMRQRYLASHVTLSHPMRQSLVIWCSHPFRQYILICDHVSHPIEP